MKVLRKNKRGAAMESAVLFMFVALMLGMLLTGVAMLTHLRVKVNNTALTREIAIEQIGENFVHDMEDFSSLQVVDNRFEKDITVKDSTVYTAVGTYTDKDNKTLTLSTKKGTLLLKITVIDGKITSWKYTE